MATMASPTSPSSFLLFHASSTSSSCLQGLLCVSPSSDSDRWLAVSVAEEGEEEAGVHGGDRSLLPLAAANVVRRDTPVPGGGLHYNAVRPERKVTARALRQPAPAADAPVQGTGPQTNVVPQRKPRGAQLRLSAPRMSLAVADLPVQGDGPKTNAVLEIKARGGGALRRPTPPGGAGPKEGSGGRGGVIHAVAAHSTPQRPGAGAPAEGTGGNGGVVHAADSSQVESS